jgi:uncharacterized membrane protein
MKIFTTILIIISILLIGFNISQIDFTNFANPKNTVVYIEIAIATCAVLILLIYKKSKELVDKTKR